MTRCEALLGNWRGGGEIPRCSRRAKHNGLCAQHAKETWRGSGQNLPKARPRWTYHFGLPDRSGMAKYLHLARSPYDLEETKARGAGKREADHWKRTDSVETFRQRIADLFQDGEPRTFNTICVELTGTTADVWFEKAPDAALWSLVEDLALVWAQELGAVWFLPASCLGPAEVDPLARWADDGGR